MGWFSCKQNCAIRVLEKQHHDCVIHIGQVNHLCVAFGAGTCTYTYASLSITSKVPNKQVAVTFVKFCDCYLSRYFTVLQMLTTVGVLMSMYESRPKTGMVQATQLLTWPMTIKNCMI